MAVKIHFSSLSFGASVDQQTGNLSVFDLVEEIRTPQIPIQLPSLVLSLAMENTQRIEFKGQVLIHIIAPGEAPAKIGSGDLRVPSERKRVKAVFRFSGFPLANFGEYRVVVSVLDTSQQKVGESILDFEVIKFQRIADAPAADPSNGGMRH